MSLNRPIRSWTGRRVWVIGASTGIGEALALQLIERGARVAVSARGGDALRAMASRAPEGRVRALPLDVTDSAEVAGACADLLAAWKGIDLVLLVAGTYRSARAWDIDLGAARRMLDTNVLGPLNVLSAVVGPLLAQGNGGIALVSSVAGYRGLPRSLTYGATKAALINLAETLYLDLHAKGLDVYVVNPGFVRTPLTTQNEFRMPAIISASEAATQTLLGMERGEFEIHYPKRFTRIMKFLRILPYGIYFALVRRLIGI